MTQTFNFSSAYAKFFAANDALFRCIDKNSVDTMKVMEMHEKMTICKNEAERVRSFLQPGSEDFKRLLNERRRDKAAFKLEMLSLRSVDEDAYEKKMTDMLHMK